MVPPRLRLRIFKSEEEPRSVLLNKRRKAQPLSPSRRQKAALAKLLRNMSLTSIIEKLTDAWIPAIYRENVRTLRTRSYRMDIPERENSAEILFTLLGIELKVGRQRFACPDLATARYLLVFARIGCGDIAIPYDITKISVIADKLEEAWQKTVLVHAAETTSLSPQARGRTRAALVRQIRTELAEIGAGDPMPEFMNSTIQRKY
jgi:hypothetical protein